jgi:hypothetical protein
MPPFFGALRPSRKEGRREGGRKGCELKQVEEAGLASRCFVRTPCWYRRVGGEGEGWKDGWCLEGKECRFRSGEEGEEGRSIDFL